jgi:hypothetical protein
MVMLIWAAAAIPVDSRINAVDSRTDLNLDVGMMTSFCMKRVSMAPDFRVQQAMVLFPPAENRDDFPSLHQTGKLNRGPSSNEPVFLLSWFFSRGFLQSVRVR